MELFRSGIVLLYEPEGETPHRLFTVFFGHKELRLSLLQSSHAGRFSKERSIFGVWGEVCYHNSAEDKDETYTITEKISLDVVLPGSQKRIRVDFGVIATPGGVPDAILDTDAVQTLGISFFALAMRTINDIRPGHGDECAICWMSMETQDQTTTHLSCKRTFHKVCLATWIATQRPQVLNDFANCPCCRGNILRSSAMTVAADAALEAAVISCFSPGTRLLSAIEYRTLSKSKFSRGTTSMLITVELPDNTFKQHFMKLASGSQVCITEGEYQAMKSIHHTAPELKLVAEPFNSKAFTHAGLEKHFFVCDFIEMTLPDSCVTPPEETWRRVSKLHRQSVSPNGQFGFHIQTYIGDIPQHVEWDSSWSSYFAKMLSHMKQIETEIRGPWKDNTTFLRMLQEVIPRLIGALERDGRKVKPSLIHGNIFGRWGTPYASKGTMLYGPSSYFAHHEMEWAFLARAGSRGLTCEDRDVVLRLLDEEGCSGLKCERPDRLELYQVYFYLVTSIEHERLSIDARNSMCITMDKLLDQYGSRVS